MAPGGSCALRYHNGMSAGLIHDLKFDSRWGAESQRRHRYYLKCNESQCDMEQLGPSVGAQLWNPILRRVPIGRFNDLAQSGLIMTTTGTLSAGCPDCDGAFPTRTLAANASLPKLTTLALLSGGLAPPSLRA